MNNNTLTMSPSISLKQLEDRVTSIFKMAQLSGQSSNDLNATIKAQIISPIHSRTPAGRLRFPIWLQGYAAGLIACENNRVWQHVEFCYRDKAGTIYSTHKQSKHRLTEEFYSAGDGHLLADMECAHVWIYTGKPYTAWQTI